MKLQPFLSNKIKYIYGPFGSINSITKKNNLQLVSARLVSCYLIYNNPQFTYTKHEINNNMTHKTNEDRFINANKI